MAETPATYKTDFCSNDFSEIYTAYFLYQLKSIPEISVRNI